MKKSLPKFKILSPEQQRELYPSKLARAHTASRNRLHAVYHDSLAKANQIEEKIRKLEQEITVIEDRVADKADKKHGGWSVWRHNKKLLHQVIAEMHHSGEPIRVEIAKLKAEADALRAPCLKELDALQKLHDRLLASVR